MSKLVAVAVALLGCGGQPAPSPVAARIATDAAPDGPDARRAVAVVIDAPPPTVDAGPPAALVAEYPELGSDGLLPTVDPCVRPDDAARAAITASVIAWTTQQPGGIEDLGPVWFGCVEPAGIVIEVSGEDRTAALPGGGTAEDKTAAWYRKVSRSGHTWILRVKGRSVAVLAQLRGFPAGYFGGTEGSTVDTLGTIGLVDLDHDGTLDALVVRDHHIAGYQRGDLVLSAVTSRSGRMTTVARFGDEVVLARGQHHQVGAPVVVRIDHSSSGEQQVIYRCIDAALVLGRCAATKTAKGVDDALAGAPAASTDPLSERLAQLAKPHWDLTDTEHGEAIGVETAAYEVRLRAALGDQPCTLTAAARAEPSRAALIAWAAKHTPVGRGACSSPPCKSVMTIVAGCTSSAGSYYELSWDPVAPTDDGIHRHAFVFAGRAGIVAVRDLIGSANPFSVGIDPDFKLGFSRHRDVAVALMVEPDAITGFANGTAVGTTAGSFSFYPREDWQSPFHALVSDSSAYWHVGAKLERLGSLTISELAPTVDGTVPNVLVDRELTVVARAALAETDWTASDALAGLAEPEVRARVLAELAILKADRALIDAVAARATGRP